MRYNVAHDKENSKFVIDVDGHLSVVDYEVDDGKMLFLSTRVHHTQEGKGIASALTEEALSYAVDNKLLIVPLCSFTRTYILRHIDKYKDHIFND